MHERRSGDNGDNEKIHKNTMGATIAVAGETDHPFAGLACLDDDSILAGGNKTDSVVLGSEAFATIVLTATKKEAKNRTYSPTLEARYSLVLQYGGSSKTKLSDCPST